MGLLSRVHRPRRLRAGMPDEFDDFWYAPAGWHGTFSQAGIRVSPELAMTVSAVWFGVTFLAKNIGSLPCILYKYLEPLGKERARGNPLYGVLRSRPNANQTAMEFWEQLVGHLLLRGNFYAVIQAGPRGFADQLLPKHPDLVTVGRLSNGRLQYSVRRTNAEPEIYTQDEMFHVRGYSSDGVKGVSMITYGANSIGTALAADSYVARFFRQGASASVAVRHPGSIGDEGVKNLRNSVSAYLTGPENVGGVLVLEENASIDKIGITPQDAQLLAMREHGVREVARWLGMPSYVFSDAGKPPTYASVEQFALDLVIHSFRPLTVRIEQCITRDLILADMVFFAEFLLDALLRGDMAARSAFYHMAILDGWMNRNEVRVKENLNPVDGLNDYLEPQNMRDANAPAGSPTAPRPLPSAPATEDGMRSVRATILAIEAAQRVVRKEIAAVTKGARDHGHDPEGWSTWLRTFYDDHAGFVSATLKLPLTTTRSYAAKHGLDLQRGGVAVMEDWLAIAPTELAAWALDGYAGEAARPTVIEIAPHIIAAPQIRVEAARVTTPAPQIAVHAPITVQPAAVSVTTPPRRVQVHVADLARQTTVQRGPNGQITGTRSTSRTRVDTMDEDEEG